MATQDAVFGALYGHPTFDGASIQSRATNVFRDVFDRVHESEAAGRPWVVANDEQGPSRSGLVPDQIDPDHDVIRTNVLWGT